MSKSIYEEALKESKDFGSMIGLKLDKVNNALEQARKQQKLLELYKKLYNGCTDYHDYDELKEIQKQIKELENGRIKRKREFHSKNK